MRGATALRLATKAVLNCSECVTKRKTHNMFAYLYKIENNDLLCCDFKTTMLVYRRFAPLCVRGGNIPTLFCECEILANSILQQALLHALCKTALEHCRRRDATCTV